MEHDNQVSAHSATAAAQGRNEAKEIFPPVKGYSRMLWNIP